MWVIKLVRVNLSRLGRFGASKYRVCVTIISCWLLLGLNIANATAEPLKDFSPARIMYESQQSANDYRLTLGSLKKVNGKWTAEREKRLSGELSRKTLELEGDYNAEEVFGFYRQQLLDQKARELFTCEGRNCGSSNSWANDRFGVQQLYGLDQFQWYTVYEVPSLNSGSVYVALYAVTRGNRRSYVQIDQLFVSESVRLVDSPAAIAATLNRGQAYIVPGLLINAEDVNIEDRYLHSIVDALRLHPTLAVYLVGHDYSFVPLAKQQVLSKFYADALRRKLVSAGIAENRLTVEGVGGLAPGQQQTAESRVELVLNLRR